ncbi:MAG: hypothetical protein D6812_06030 [Deltaproteobacteria bacterium]|nr:MAG: hypothetical protein D6812_06030 [Deltaproteobacteria bacterium]
MKCDRVEKLLSPYIDRELTLEEMPRMTEHLRQCASCKTQYEVLLTLRALISSEKRFEAPPDFERVLWRKIEARQPGFFGRFWDDLLRIWERNHLAPAFAALPLVASLFLVLWVTRTQEGHPPTDLTAEQDLPSRVENHGSFPERFLVDETQGGALPIDRRSGERTSRARHPSYFPASLPVRMAPVPLDPNASWTIPVGALPPTANHASLPLRTQKAFDSKNEGDFQYVDH